MDACQWVSVAECERLGSGCEMLSPRSPGELTRTHAMAA